MSGTPLRNPAFRRLFAGQVASLFGSGLATVALALMAYSLAPDRAGSILGTALAIKMVSYVAIAPLAGALAARLPRRAYLVALDLIRAAAVACLPFVDSLWQVYALIFVVSAASAGFTPVFQATIPDILKDDEQYTRALSWSRIAYDLENLLSPMLAAALLTVTAFHTLFVLNALGFLASAALVLSVALPRGRPPAREAGLWSDIAFGGTLYLRTLRLRALLLLFLGVAAAGAMVIVNTVVYVRSVLALGDTDVALAFAAFGAGSMAVALALPRLLNRAAERTVTVSGGVMLSTGLALATALPSFGGMLVLWAVLGAGASLVQTPAARILRRSCHEEDRPPLYAAHFALSHLCWLFAYLLAGHGGAALGLPATFAAAAALAAAATALAWLLWPAEDKAELEHEHEEIVHAHWHTHDDAHHVHDHDDGNAGENEPHSHVHRHGPVRHRHTFVIDLHHRHWP
jgi:MFS family permease